MCDPLRPQGQPNVSAAPEAWKTPDQAAPPQKVASRTWPSRGPARGGRTAPSPQPERRRMVGRWSGGAAAFEHERFNPQVNRGAIGPRAGTFRDGSSVRLSVGRFSCLDRL